MSTFKLKQVVKGHAAGTFVILGFRVINNDACAQLKCVNPNDHTQVAPGELALPLSLLRPLTYEQPNS